MRTRNPNYGRARDVTLGRSATPRSGGTLRVVAGSVDLNLSTLQIDGATLAELDDDEGVLTVEASLGEVGDGTTTVDDVAGIIVPPGGFTDNGDGTITLNFLTSVFGEQAELDVDSAAGATQTIDCAIANVFDLTLTANCVISISNPPGPGVASTITVILRQGGSGSYTVTWPGSVDWQDTDGTGGGAAPTLFTAVGAQDVIELSTLDGGGTWGGAIAGGATASSVSALGFVGELLISDTPSTPLVFADLIQNEAETDLVYADV